MKMRTLRRLRAHASRHARRRDFDLAERGAVRRFGALLVRCAVTDDRLAADQCRLVRIDGSRDQRGLDRFGIVAIDIAQHFPAVRFETLGRVVSEPAVHFTVDRNAVVVVDRNEFAELECAGKRGDLV